MAKTTLVDGSIVTPLYLNTINGTDANTGHTHDGLNQDGSVPKIRLTNGLDITGIAPSVNVTHKTIATITFSTGGGTYAFSCILFKVGNICGFQINPGQGGISLPAVSGGPLTILLSIGGGTWPSDIFGTSTKNSTGLVYAPVTTGSSSWAANVRYRGTGQTMELEPISGGAYATSDVVVIEEGFSACFALSDGEF